MSNEQTIGTASTIRRAARLASEGAAALLLLAGTGCRVESPPDRTAGAQRPRNGAAVVLDETFVTRLDTLDNVDSPVAYHAGDTSWVLASAKSTNVILVYDAATGVLLRRVGQAGAASGALRRPNGLAVVDSVLLVVERDNARVQGFLLPGFSSLGAFGERELVKPYGIAWQRIGPSAWSVYVTDNYEYVEDQIPPDSALGRRVKQYEITLKDRRLAARLVRTFGDTAGAGMLRSVESIAVDPAFGRLIIAEETPGESLHKVYDLDGRFTGAVMGRGAFPQQAEGLALWPCGDSAGYWLSVDQGDSTNTFHVFHRASLEHVGAFTGRVTRRTDGVALTTVTFGPFPAGALYASHVDGGITALSLADVAHALGLARCRGTR